MTMGAPDGWKAIADELLAKMGGPADDAAVHAWQAKQDALARKSRLREADVPGVVLADVESPNLDTTRHPIPALIKAIDAGQRMVLLTGLPGSGKTVAAVFAVQHFPGAYFARVPDLLALQWSAKTRWQAERATLRSALVLDELGEEADHKRAEVDQLLSGRYNLATSCITICTTNLRTSEFRDAYGERIVSRFRDPRYCAIIACKDTLRPRRGKQRR